MTRHHPSGVSASRLWAALCFVVAGLAGFAYWIKMEQDLRILLDRAHSSESRGELRSAQANLEAYLARRPNDGEAIASYARVLERQARTPEEFFLAYSIHEQAAQLLPKNVETRLSLADLDIQFGRFSEARDWLEEAAMNKLKNSGQRERYALLLTASSRTRKQKLEAVSVLEKAVQLDPDRDALRLTLVDELLELKHYSECKPHLDQLLERLPQDGELEGRLARCLRGLGNDSQAETLLKQAVARDSARIEDYRQLAELAAARGDFAAADSIMDVLTRLRPGSTEAYLERSLYRSDFQRPGAWEDIEEAKKYAPNDLRVILASAQIARTPSELASVRERLQNLVEQRPNDRRPLAAWCQVVLRQEGPQGAIAALRSRLETDTTSFVHDLRWSLADLLIQTNQLEEARAEIQKLENSECSNELLDVLNAALLASQNHWDQAMPMLLRVEPELTQDDAASARVFSLLCEGWSRQGDYAKLIEGLRIAARLHPHREDLRQKRIEALWLLGRDRETLSELQVLRQRSLEMQLLLIRLLIKEAAKTVRDTGRSQWLAVDDALSEASRIAPNSLQVALAKAEVQSARKLWTEASQTLTEAKQRWPGSLEVFLALASVEQAKGRPDQAWLILDQGERLCGDRVEIRLARIRWAVARKILTTIQAQDKDLNKFSLEHQEHLLTGLGDAYAQLNQAELARQVWERQAKLNPNNFAARSALAELAIFQNDANSLNRLSEEFRRIEGETGACWRLTEAYRLWIAQPEKSPPKVWDEVRRLINETIEKQPDWPRPYALLAEVETRSNRVGAAITAWQTAIAKGEQRPSALRKAASLLSQAGKSREAEALAAKIRDLTPSGYRGWGSMTQTAFQDRADIEILMMANREQALKQAREAVNPLSVDPEDHLWLARLHQESGWMSEAEASYRKAIALEPNRSDSWDGLIRLIASSPTSVGRLDRTLQEAQSALSQQPDAYQTLAKTARERAESVPKTSGTSATASSSAIRDQAENLARSGRFREAEPLLRLLTQRADVPPGAQAWARRTLAVGLATGTKLEWSESLDLVENNLRTGSSAIDLKTKAYILSSKPSKRAAAITILKKLVRDRLASAEERFSLAKMLDAEHDWVVAESHLEALTREFPQQTEYWAYLAQAQLKRQQWAEANIAITELERREANSFRAISLRARLLKEQGKSSQAVDLVYSQAAKHPGRPEQETIATLYEECGRPDLAEPIFRQYGESDPRLNLAQFLARRQKSAESWTLIRATSDPNSTAIPNAIATLAAAPDLNAQTKQEVSAWLESPPNPTISLQIAWGIWLSRWGDPNQAVAVYRQILKNDPENLAALNNLAWLLAVRNLRDSDLLDLINQAIELAGPLPSLLDTRGLAYLALGQTDSALKDFLNAAEVQSSPTTLFHLAQAQYQAGDRLSAAQTFNQAQKAGLLSNKLHPLEQNAHQKLVALLGRSTARR